LITAFYRHATHRIASMRGSETTYQVSVMHLAITYHCR